MSGGRGEHGRERRIGFVRMGYIAGPPGRRNRITFTTPKRDWPYWGAAFRQIVIWTLAGLFSDPPEHLSERPPASHWNSLS